MMCKHENMTNLPFHNQKHCESCGLSEREIELTAQLAALAPVVAAAREYTEICQQITTATEPTKGYMLDLARRRRLAIADAIAFLDTTTNKNPSP